jgi:hypothetical protein
VDFKAFRMWAGKVGAPVLVNAEPQSSDYESGLAHVEGSQWHIRTARTTPAKPGAFVAFWRRGEDGETHPFVTEHVASGLLAFVEQQGKRGVFRFTVDHLVELGIVSDGGSGKRGFRVYPPWCVSLNPQAQAVQGMQSPAFEEY